ncbi:MAG TPA: hypothetical protein VMF65_19565 [Acidimicrobiales bacterium]|nr:hypothetical protein [Acidimicrobiales bacterium]
MYPPAMSYQIYRVERGLALTDAERRAADEHAGHVAAALGGQWRALARLITLAGPRAALRRWDIFGRRTAGAVPVSPLHPGGATIVAISAYKDRCVERKRTCSTCSSTPSTRTST